MFASGKPCDEMLVFTDKKINWRMELAKWTC